MKIVARLLPVVVFVAAAIVVAAAQVRAPRTSWGTPDLQGLWNTNTFAPFERAQKYGTRQTMTEAEYMQELAALQQRNARPGRDSRDVGGKSGLGTEKDVARAYNEFWFGDKPTRLSHRTSMVIDPPDGRLPA